MNVNGFGPASGDAPAVPIWLAAGHVSALAACASVHSVTVGIAPTRPGGSVVLTCDEVLLAVGAGEVEREVGVPPAVGVVVDVLWPGENGERCWRRPPLPLLSTLNGVCAVETRPVA